MEDCGFPEDIAVEIFRRLPMKSLARFKCVSKRWLSLISDRTRVFPQTTQVGIVYQTYVTLCRTHREQYSKYNARHPPSRIYFLSLDNRGIAFCLPPSHFYDIDLDYLLLSSYNGFLLFSKAYPPAGKNSVVAAYLVYHPATKSSWELSHRKHGGGLNVGLVSDGHHFKLLLFFANPKRFTSDIFSSENEEWGGEKWWQPSFGVPRPSPKTIDSAKSVFLKGAFHWIWSNYLVIYHLGNDDYERVNLPVWRKDGTAFRDRRPYQYIWNSQGHVNYCYISCVDHRIVVWGLHRLGANGKPYKHSFKWVEKHRAVLTPPLEETEHSFSFSPFAFNEDFEILYLMSRGRIFSYSLATREMKEAWTSPFQDTHYFTLFNAFPMTYLSQFDAPAMTIGDDDLCNTCPDGMVKRGKLL